MTLTIDDVIALRANCDDYVNAFKVSGKITINDRDVEKPVHPVQGLVGTLIEMMSDEVKYAARLLELPKPILYCV